MMVLPRQARDKHKENSKKDRFVAGCGWLAHGCAVAAASVCGWLYHIAHTLLGAPRNVVLAPFTDEKRSFA